VINEAEAELFGNALLKHLQLLIDEFDDVACLNIDQMIVMRFGGRFIARAAIPELVPLKDSRLLEQPDRSVDGGDGNVGIDRRSAGVQRLDVGVILAVAEHPRNGLALLGDPKALVGAQRLDVDLTRHDLLLG
jgi:hypothetical protein